MNCWWNMRRTLSRRWFCCPGVDVAGSMERSCSPDMIKPWRREPAAKQGWEVEGRLWWLCGCCSAIIIIVRSPTRFCGEGRGRCALIKRGMYGWVCEWGRAGAWLGAGLASQPVRLAASSHVLFCFMLPPRLPLTVRGSPLKRLQRLLWAPRPQSQAHAAARCLIRGQQKVTGWLSDCKSRWATSLANFPSYLISKGSAVKQRVGYGRIFKHWRGIKNDQIDGCYFMF